jgi:hypothetical protein
MALNMARRCEVDYTGSVLDTNAVFFVNYVWEYKFIHRAKQGRFLIFISYLIMDAKQTSETLRFNKIKNQAMRNIKFMYERKR